MAWLCKCGTLNSGVNTRCAAFKASAFYRTLEHDQISPNTFDYLMMLKAEREDKKFVTDNEEKFAAFFNEETIVFSSLSPAEQISRIETLEEIAFETRARLTAGKSVMRDKQAKAKVGSEWTISPTGPDSAVTDSINKVEQRRKRMSKLDKQSAKLAALGFTQKEIDAMTKGLRQVAVSDTDEEKEKRIRRAVDNVMEPGSNPDETPDDLNPALVRMNPNRPSFNGKTGVAVPEIKPIEESTENDKPITLSDLSKLKFD